MAQIRICSQSRLWSSERTQKTVRVELASFTGLPLMIVRPPGIEARVECEISTEASTKSSFSV